MKSLYKLLVAAVVIAAAMIMPVSADSNAQMASGVIIGHDNTMVNDNDNYQYDYQNDQHATSVAVGHGNSVSTSNVNIAGNVVNGASAVSNTQMVIIPKGSANYYGLDTGVVAAPSITSLYSGQVLIVMNDEVTGKNQLAGDVYKYTVKSSLPVLTYVINANDAPKAEFDIDVAPVYDPSTHKYELGNLDTVYVNKYRSPFQQFEAVMPEDGRYALVIDTRVAQLLNGKQSKITDDSVDVTYYVEHTGYKPTPAPRRSTIGTVSMYPILQNGMANTVEA